MPIQRTRGRGGVEGRGRAFEGSTLFHNVHRWNSRISWRVPHLVHLHPTPSFASFFLYSISFLTFSSPLSTADLYLDQDTTLIIIHENSNAHIQAMFMTPNLLDPAHYCRCIFHITTPLSSRFRWQHRRCELFNTTNIFPHCAITLPSNSLNVVYPQFRKTLGSVNLHITISVRLCIVLSTLIFLFIAYFHTLCHVMAHS
jgi:hypothetical protein